MQYTEIDNKIIMKDYDSFEIDQILECGQCFRFKKIAEKYYEIIAFGKVLYIKQNSEQVEFYPCNIQEFKSIWIDYFDLTRDYNKIKEILIKNDKILEEAIHFAPGIRILKQDPFETLISFIISQNNRIPQIKQVVKNISWKYGSKIQNSDNYAFPTLDQLLHTTLDELMECKTGFRAKYIIDATEKISNNIVDFGKAEKLSALELRENLMLIKGVGPKVADCVLLFGFSKYEYFPTDVWIKRIIQNFYFDNQETSVQKIHDFTSNKFGEYSGFAQQYLFNYARSNKVS